MFLSGFEAAKQNLENVFNEKNQLGNKITKGNFQLHIINAKN